MEWGALTIGRQVLFGAVGAGLVLGAWFLAVKSCGDDDAPSVPRLERPSTTECEGARLELRRRRSEVEAWIDALRASLGPRPDPLLQAIERWLSTENPEAEAWISAGCPKDGVRGVYRDSDGRTLGFRLFRYDSFGEYAAAHGLLPTQASTPAATIVLPEAR